MNPKRDNAMMAYKRAQATCQSLIVASAEADLARFYVERKRLYMMLWNEMMENCVVTKILWG